MLDSLDTLIAFALIFTVVSLLITIVVQMITSLLNLRGKNLAWGIAEAFEALAPELKAAVEGRGKILADHLLQDDLISDSQFWFFPTSKAKAVRPDELFSLLHRIAIGKRPGLSQQTDPKKAEREKTERDAIKADITALFKSLGVPEWVFQVSEAKKQEWEQTKVKLMADLAALPIGQDKDKERIRTELDKIEARLKNTGEKVEEAAIRWASQGEQEIQKIYQQFEHWFEIGQERAQEWFTTHARLITGILGLIFAFVLQLDTLEIYKLVSSNRAVRDSLVAQTQSVVQQGEKVLKNQTLVLQDALQPTSKTGSNAFLTNVNVSATDTVGTVKAKIRDACTNRSQAEVDKLLEGFDEQTTQVVTNRLAEYSGEYKSMARSLDKTGFELFPKDSWRWAERDLNGKVLKHHWWNHFFGMLFSALLLSLGAPFWFNTLKSLASLRSSVAKNISDEEKAQQKNAKTDQPSKAPPSVI